MFLPNAPRFPKARRRAQANRTASSRRFQRISPSRSSPSWPGRFLRRGTPQPLGWGSRPEVRSSQRFISQSVKLPKLLQSPFSIVKKAPVRGPGGRSAGGRESRPLMTMATMPIPMTPTLLSRRVLRVPFSLTVAVGGPVPLFHPPDGARIVARGGHRWRAAREGPLGSSLPLPVPEGGASIQLSLKELRIRKSKLLSEIGDFSTITATIKSTNQPAAILLVSIFHFLFSFSFFRVSIFSAAAGSGTHGDRGSFFSPPTSPQVSLPPWIDAVGPLRRPPSHGAVHGPG